jgi:ectoine hydroxylase-related dioxygenase (phytanoyl-CoA dioxygenase family)
MVLYEYERYVTSAEKLRETLDRYGVAVIPGVLDQAECEQIVQGTWDFLETITRDWEKPISRNDETTWKEIYKLMPLHNMLIQHHQVGHAEVSWKVRQNTKIVDIFAKLYNVPREDLLVSFDGLSFHLPFEKTGKRQVAEKTWYHTDQSYTRNQSECVQSWVTGLDVNQGDGTLGFLEGSHGFHREFAEKYQITDTSDWYKLTDLELKFYKDRGCEERRIMCPKGSMVFWDSRTIHCGVQPQANRPAPNIRSIIYLCYMPRSQCSRDYLEKKKKAFNEMRTTNHYPCKPKLFPIEPRVYGKDQRVKVSEIRAPVVNALGQRLAGF